MPIRATLSSVKDFLRAVEAGEQTQYDLARRRALLAQVEEAERRLGPPPFRRILIGVDHSPASDWAVDAGLRLATDASVAVMLVHVIDTSKAFSQDFELALATYLEQVRPAAQDLLARVAARFPQPLSPRLMVREGGPATELVAAAREWSADLVVVGTHSHGRLATLVLGSTAHGVARRADCPVLTVGHALADLGSAGAASGGAVATPAPSPAGPAQSEFSMP
jgi:nucleotide-binding universal stress UspA family protein